MRENLSWDDSARWGRRIYVFGVTAAAIFFVGLLVSSIVAANPRRADLPQPSDMSIAENPAERLPWGMLQAIRKDVVRSRRRLELAENDLFQFLNQRFLAVRETSIVPIGSPPVAIQLSTVEPAPVDPKWAELENELTSAQRHRSDLLKTMQPLHPEVERLDLSIAELRQKLEQKPVTAGTSPASLAQAPVAESAPTVVRPSNVSEEAARAAYQRLLVAAGRGRTKYEAAMERERQAYGEFGAAFEMATRLETSRPIEIAEPEVAPAPMGPISLVALAIGMLAAICVRRIAPTYRAVREIEESLKVPVLATLSPAISMRRGAGAMAAPATLDPAWVRHGVSCSQFLLAIAVGIVLVLAIVDQPTLRHLIKPLSEIM